MIKRGIYLESIHHYAYRREECAVPLVTGVCMLTPDARNGVKHEPRLCYEVTYSDGFVDYVTLSDVENGSYKLVSY